MASVRSVSVFLMNRREQDPRKEAEDDTLYVFQPEIEVRSDRPFPLNRLVRPTQPNDRDNDVADPHYADVPEYATGYGVCSDSDLSDGECRVVRNAWKGQAKVEVTEISLLTGAALSTPVLGSLEDAASARTALRPLVALYREWIQDQKSCAEALEGERKETANEPLRLAGIAAIRIQDGINVLASHADMLVGGVQESATGLLWPRREFGQKWLPSGLQRNRRGDGRW